MLVAIELFIYFCSRLEAFIVQATYHQWPFVNNQTVYVLCEALFEGISSFAKRIRNAAKWQATRLDKMFSKDEVHQFFDFLERGAAAGILSAVILASWSCEIPVNRSFTTAALLDERQCCMLVKESIFVTTAQIAHAHLNLVQAT